MGEKEDNPNATLARLEATVEHHGDEIGALRTDFTDLRKAIIGPLPKGESVIERLTRIETSLTTWPKAVTVLLSIETIILTGIGLWVVIG